MRYSCLLVSALILTCGNRLHAQARTRHGLWMDIGLGMGSLHASSDTLRGRTQTGDDFIWDFGWTLNSHLRAGVGVDQWTRKQDGGGNQNWVTSFNILADYYPLARHNLYLRVGAARANYAFVHVRGERADSTYFDGTAWGITGAVGGDIPMYAFASVRPVLSYSYGPPRALRGAGGTLIASGWTQHLLSLCIGVVIHPMDSR